MEKKSRKSSKKKSTRTTFTLSKEGYEAIKWLSQNPRRTFKEVLERICADLLVGKYEQSRLKAAEPPERSLLRKVMSVAEEVGQDSFDLSVRKTYVISEGFLDVFKYLSTRYKIPRDVLVDCSLRIRKEEEEKEKEELQANYKAALKIITHCQSVVEDAAPRLDELLWDDRELLLEFYYISSILDDIWLPIFTRLSVMEGQSESEDTKSKKDI